MHVDLSFSYLRSAEAASFDKKSSIGTAQQDPDPHPHPDLLVRDVDPRIRIHTKIAWIRTTEIYDLCFVGRS
jgi:hypothetical protein